MDFLFVDTSTMMLLSRSWKMPADPGASSGALGVRSSAGPAVQRNVDTAAPKEDRPGLKTVPSIGARVMVWT
jgi:hypothetical protein